MFVMTPRVLTCVIVLFQAPVNSLCPTPRTGRRCPTPSTLQATMRRHQCPKVITPTPNTHTPRQASLRCPSTPPLSNSHPTSSTPSSTGDGRQPECTWWETTNDGDLSGRLHQDGLMAFLTSLICSAGWLFILPPVNVVYLSSFHSNYIAVLYISSLCCIVKTTNSGNGAWRYRSLTFVCLLSKICLSKYC